MMEKMDLESAQIEAHIKENEKEQIEEVKTLICSK